MAENQKTIEARKAIEFARTNLENAKKAAKEAKMVFDAAQDRFLALYDKDNGLNLFNGAVDADDSDDE